MGFRYDEIGDRLKAFRLGSALSADEIARRIGISRTALYRLEKGELVKLETLEKLSDLLEVSVPTLLGVGIEWIPSAVSYFERTRQVEEKAEQIVVLAGPISFLLASDRFEQSLEMVLNESIPEDASDRARALADIGQIMELLRERKRVYRQRNPGIVNLISAMDIERFLRNGFIGRTFLPEKVLAERRALARAEVEHFASVIEDEPMGVQIGLVTGTLPHTGFQIFRQPDRKILTISPFRLGEQPNIRLGVAMLTSAPEALALHERSVKEMWRTALKGRAASEYLRELLASNGRSAR
ncbi:helix-turn-helix domain-containing protein [Propylenella binzhouense]|uniref:XRE family transcriptional regulator n=1 Tax=Propylenella binzhouense TaxID=2555902 RepID=A0A964T6A1_9HYPH|nr:helix-turn-helix transcriptional regulator [Propylenella binzhouense]MYZ48192.1 XRE family transcriptional regulator [Propylenella binzhouense]